MLRHILATFLLALLTVSSALEAQSPQSSEGSSPRAKGEHRWILKVLRDFPQEAKEKGISGSVGMNLDVDARGRVTACRVSSSSGHKILDDAACVAMERYSRFEPARSSSGDKVPGKYSTRITYDYMP